MVFLMKSATLCLLAALWIGPTAETDQNGKRYDPVELGPGYTVLDFAASWCKPCWQALPHVEALNAEFPSVRVMVISVDTKQAGRDQLVRKLNLTVPVIWDRDHRWAEKFQPAGMPTTMIVDATGRVIYRHVGFSEKSWRRLRAELAGLATKADGRSVPETIRH